jgi:CDP-glucose 4,6-dehydratase
MGTWNILEACRKLGSVKRIIAASSDKAYGEQEKLPYLETHTLNGLYPYDASKVCADVLARCYYKMYKLPIGITRLANVYGGGDFNFNRIIPDTIRSLIFNRPPLIRSDGTYLRDYLYIKDAVKAYLVLAEALDLAKYHGEVFNFGSCQPVKVLDLVKLIIRISGKTKLKPKILKIASGEIKAQYLSIEKAKAMLGWRPQFILSAGIKETYRWYQDFFKKIKTK